MRLVPKPAVVPMINASSRNHYLSMTKPYFFLVGCLGLGFHWDPGEGRLQNVSSILRDWTQCDQERAALAPELEWICLYGVWEQQQLMLIRRCPLFARKFSNGSEAAAMHAVFSMLLKDSSRHQQRWDGACNATLSHPYNKAVQTPLAGMEDKADADGTSDGSSSVNDSATATREAGLEPEGPTVKQVGSSSRSSIREERRQARRRNRIRQPR